MPLEPNQAEWLYRFTLGEVRAGDFPDMPAVANEIAVDKEELKIEIQKENELAKAMDRIAVIKADRSQAAGSGSGRDEAR
jgi:hypothetical protein